jgi:hypothetical protein
LAQSTAAVDERVLILTVDFFRQKFAKPEVNRFEVIHPSKQHDATRWKRNGQLRDEDGNIDWLRYSDEPSMFALHELSPR